MSPFPPVPKFSKELSTPTALMAFSSSWRREVAASLSACAAEGAKVCGSGAGTAARGGVALDAISTPVAIPVLGPWP